MAEDPIEEIITVVEQLHDALKDVSNRVDALESRVSGGAAADGEEPEASPQPRDWAGTAGPQDWAALTRWVDWLVATYQVPDCPLSPCWPLHPGVVEELVALRLAWHAARLEADQGPTSAMDLWHDRSLHPTLQRVAGKTAPRYPIRSCTLTRHVDEPEPRLTDQALLPV